MFSALKMSRTLTGFKGALKTDVSEVHAVSFKSLNFETVTEFEYGVRTAKPSTDTYTDFKSIDRSRGFFYFYLS
jgi:hypothetical protein